MYIQCSLKIVQCEVHNNDNNNNNDNNGVI